MNNDLISRSELKKAIEELAITEELVDYDCDDVSTTGVSQYLDRPDVLDLIDNAPTVNLSLNLDNISDEQIQRFKMIWQRANSKGLRAINEDRQSGHWILEGEDCDNGGNNIYQCSKCFYRDTHSESAIVPYCWHCGAYMLSEESGQEVSNGES